MADKINNYLNNASTQAYNILKKSTEDFRPDVDRSIHVLNLDKEVIIAQLLQRAISKRGRGVGASKFSDSELEIASDLANKFITAVKRAAKETDNFLSVDLQGNNLSYTASSNTIVQDGIVIVAKVPGVVAFNKAKSLIIAGEKSIVNDFNAKLSKRSSQVDKIFDTGHLSGRSVAEEMQMAAAAKFASPSTTRGSSYFRPSVSILQEIDFDSNDPFFTLVQKTRQTRLTDRAFLLELRRTVKPEFKKYIKIGSNTVVMAVEPQSWEYNNFMAAIEKTEKAAAKGLIKEIKDLGAEYWAKKPGSPSTLENIIKLLIKEATKIDNSKKKPKNTLKMSNFRGRDEPNTKRSKKIGKVSSRKNLNPTSSSADKLVLLKQNNSESPARARNWSSLLPLINAKLTPRVIANMRLPSLVNRTGTFAQSARVINIETTREGFPTFVYDYERDPYDVFDRTAGRSPWNTPERDPRTLVDKSVREIVREMAIGRFYTRRA